MKPIGTQSLKSRWLAACVHAGLWLLLYLAITNLGGKAPEFRESEAFSPPSSSPAPVTQLEAFFSPGIWPKSLVGTGALSPFLTRHFIPPPAPPAPPAPPPPTTRKIELTYLGFYQTGEGPKQAIVKFETAFLVSPLGARVLSNLFVAQANMQTLVLTNPAAQTNILSVNTKKEIEVPIR